MAMKHMHHGRCIHGRSLPEVWRRPFLLLHLLHYESLRVHHCICPKLMFFPPCATNNTEICLMHNLVAPCLSHQTETLINFQLPISLTFCSQVLFFISVPSLPVMSLMFSYGTCSASDNSNNSFIVWFIMHSPGACAIIPRHVHLLLQ